MTEYSREPPRKDLVLHLTFDDRSQDNEPLDLSPQGHAASAVTGSVFLEPGSVGVGFSFDGSTYIDLPTGIISDTESFTVAFSLDPEDRPDEQRLVSLRGDITFTTRLTAANDLEVWTGTWHTVQTNVTEPVHFSFTHDASTDENVVRIDGKKVLTYTEAIASDADSNRIGASGFDASAKAHSIIDEVRVYRKILPVDQQVDLFEIGSVHGQLDNLGDAWDNPGIPYRIGAANANLSGALGEAHDANFRDLDRIRDAIHIDSASGIELDRKGRDHGILRKTGESDAVYRARIKGTLAAGRSRGTFDDLLETTAVVVETTEDRIFIDEQFDTDPATAFIYVRSEDLDEANLTASDVTAILKDAVPGGHDVQVVKQGANPFTVIDDTQANDPDQGLTSDSIATGGGLVSDV